MPFSQRNVLVVYNTSDEASEELANSYIALKAIELANTMPVSVDTDSTFESMSEYTDNLETPIRNKILELRDSGTPIACVVLSFRIPILINDNGIKSVASRLSSCLLAERTAGTDNSFYLSLNEETIASGDCLLIAVTHLDAPTLLTARKRINETASIASGIPIDGYAYFDANDRYDGSVESMQWMESVSNAARFCQFNKITADIEVDGGSSIFSRIVDGSIVFSSGIEYAGTGYFKDTSKAKAFFFNADDDGFSEPRSVTSQKPAMQALEFGYAMVAGMVGSPPSINVTSQYPDPRAIVYACSNGIPLGCGIIWSQKVIGDHISFFGDPLGKFYLPSAEQVKFDAIEGYMSAIQHIAQARALLRIREMYASRIIRVISASDGYDLKKDFLKKAKSITVNEDGMALGLLADPSSELRNISKHIGYAVYDTITEPSFEELIRLHGKKIPLSFLRSNVDANLIITRIGSQLIQPRGIANIQFRLPNISGTPRFFHMKVKAYDMEDNVVFDVDSINRPDLWRYEFEPGKMRNITTEGIYTALAGRYIEFTQPEGASPPFVEIRGVFSILDPGEEPEFIHQEYWRTQE